MTMTPEQLRDLADIADGQGIMADGDIYRAHADALDRAERAEAVLEGVENSIVDEIGGTVDGAPTNRLNYLQRIRQLVRAEAALAEAERKCERLRFHAEAMAKDLELSYEVGESSLAAYRAEFKE